MIVRVIKEFFRSADDYVIALCRPREETKTPDNQIVKTVVCKGQNLITVADLDIGIEGKWKKSTKNDDWEFLADYSEVLEGDMRDRKNAIAYLSSGVFRGIGKATAKAIYKAFGDKCLEVIEKEPERLTEVKGISQKKQETITISYAENKGAATAIKELSPYGVPIRTIVQGYRKHGENLLNALHEDPYELGNMLELSFASVDRIALERGGDKRSEQRFRHAIRSTLKMAQFGGICKNSGHTCLPGNVLVSYTLRLMGIYDKSRVKGVSKDWLRVVKQIKILEATDLAITNVNGIQYVARKYTNDSEKLIAEYVMRISSAPQQDYEQAEIDKALKSIEAELNTRLAPEQEHGVCLCLREPISIITGGPGTGKTMVLRFAIRTIEKLKPDAKIALCAPTGRAARRMTESTGRSACTIHRALGLLATDGDREMKYDAAEVLDCDVLIVDEISMLDVYLARALLSAVPTGTRLILVGDVDQLPSIGPGAVLANLIQSQRIPVVQFTKVYRQENGSRIALNAAMMRLGRTSLQYGCDFKFIEASNGAEAAEQICRLYQRAVAARGRDNVAVLTPWRKSKEFLGETTVNGLNPVLQSIVNPAPAGALEMRGKNCGFHKGDKVMQTRNTELVSNGDIGYVTEIKPDDGMLYMTVDFGDGRIVEYAKDELEDIELAYATTIHKSQGSEYDVVIINVMDGHSKMLKRNLIYTAITRAKSVVVIVGQQQALLRAVAQSNNDERCTLLKEMLEKKFEV